MFLFKCSRPGDRSGSRFVPREDDPESGFVPREDDAESGFVPREDDPESGCSGRDDGRCLPEKVKKLTSHDVYLRSWVEEGEIERAPVLATGRPTNYVDEVFCFEVENGVTISDIDYSPLDLQTSLSADGATCRMSGNAYEAPADYVVTFLMFPGDDPEFVTSSSTTHASSASSESLPEVLLKYPVVGQVVSAREHPSSDEFNWEEEMYSTVAISAGDDPEFGTSSSTTPVSSASSESFLEVRLNNPVVEQVVNAREELSSDEFTWEEERLARAVVSIEDVLGIATIRTTRSLCFSSAAIFDFHLEYPDMELVVRKDVGRRKNHTIVVIDGPFQDDDPNIKWIPEMVALYGQSPDGSLRREDSVFTRPFWWLLRKLGLSR